VIGGDVGDAELRQELLELVLQVSFRRQKVTLASGAESNFYLDLRQTRMRPRGLALAGALMFETLRWRAR
jgi:orotate phosphoribosyltransferase